MIAISPEGTIRHWPNISRNYIDSSIDLEREVALSLDVITYSGEFFFPLFWRILQIDVNIGVSINK